MHKSCIMYKSEISKIQLNTEVKEIMLKKLCRFRHTRLPQFLLARSVSASYLKPSRSQEKKSFSASFLKGGPLKSSTYSELQSPHHQCNGYQLQPVTMQVMRFYARHQAMQEAWRQKGSTEGATWPLDPGYLLVLFNHCSKENKRSAVGDKSYMLLVLWLLCQTLSQLPFLLDPHSPEGRRVSYPKYPDV